MENNFYRGKHTSLTELWITNCNDSDLAEVIKRDKKRGEERERASTTKGEPLDPVRFTSFMTEFYERNQTTLYLIHFETPTKTKAEIELCLRRAKRCKSPSINGVHNEMLQVKPELMAELIYETSKLAGRTKSYP